MTPGILLVLGKYLLLILIYAFILHVFRALISHTVTSTSDVRAPRTRRLEQAAVPSPSGRRATLGRPCLLVLRSRALIAGQRLPLAATTSIGRQWGNTIVLNDRYVSSHHALVLFQDGRWLVRDCNSTNGTFVNGRRVTGDVPIRDGDEITIGSTVLRFTAGVNEQMRRS